MHSTSVSSVSAYTAHREWASRPPDERFTSVHALFEAARARRDRTHERRLELSQVHTVAPTDDSLVLREPFGRTSALTHWSFEQLAGIAGAPPRYLRTLPATIRARLAMVSRKLAGRRLVMRSQLRIATLSASWM